MTTLSYNKRSGTSGIGGQLYEIKLSIYALLECFISKKKEKITRFFLATNVREADNFDDIVIKYLFKENDIEKSKVYFIQAKHREKKYKNPVSIEAMFSDSEKEDFNLRKYFKSFMIIRNNFQNIQLNDFSCAGMQDPIFNSDINDAEFIIYTNNSSKFEKNNKVIDPIIKLDPDLLLDLSTMNDDIYQIKYDSKNFDILKYPLDFFTLINSLFKLIKSNKSEIDINSHIFRKYYAYLSDFIIDLNDEGEGRFKESFINGSDNNPDKVNNLRKKLIEKCTTKKNKLESILQALRNKKIKISPEIGANCISEERNNIMQPDFKDDVIEFFINKLKLYCNQFDEAQLENEIKAKIKAHYSADENTIYNYVYEKMQNWWKDDNCNTYLTENDNWFLEANQTSALNILYLSAKKDIQNMRKYCLNFNNESVKEMESLMQKYMIINIIANENTKFLIRLKVYQIINNSNELMLDSIKSMKYFFCDENSPCDQVTMAFQGQIDYLIIENQNKSHSEEFTKKVYNIVKENLNKRLIFISSNYSMPELVMSDKKYIEIKDSNICFSNLDCQTQTKILNERNILFQGYEVTLSQVIQEELKTYIDEELTFKLIDNTQNIEIGSKLNGLKDVKEYYIKRSFLPKYDINDEDDDRIVIVAAGPGMGKTTFLNSLEEVPINTENIMWKVKIDLNQYQTALKEFKSTGYINETSIINFLTGALKLQKVFDKELFKSYFKKGNVFIMFDGFDEITPYYKEEVISILKILKSSNIKKIIITTRLYAATYLEKELNSTTITLQPFCKNEQKSFLKSFWKNYMVKNINAEDLIVLNKILELISINQFMEIPLHLKIFADYCEDLFKKHSNENKINEINLKLFENINLFTMYEHIIKMKYVHIFCEEKRKIDLNIGSNMDSVDEEYIRFKDEHKKMALYALFDVNIFKSLFSEREVLEIEKTIQYINQGKIKAGVITTVVENLPIFVHRTFAEFFVAILIRELLQENRQEEVFDLFDKIHFTINQNEMIRKFFDLSFIDEKHVIHNAIINDLKNIEEIISNSENPIELINNPDNGGRTPMHLVAAYDNSHYIACVLLSYFSSYKKTDEIFKWQPISYAMFYQNLLVYDLLCALEPNDNFLLEAMMSRKNYHYTDLTKLRILMIAAISDYVDTAKFIFQESSNMSTYINGHLEFTFNYTLLHIAVKSNSLNFVDFLIENGASLIIKNGLGETPIDYAVRFGSDDMKNKIMKQVKNLGIEYTFDEKKNRGLVINDWSSSSFKMQRLIEVVRNNRLRFMLGKLRKDIKIVNLVKLEDKNILIDKLINALETIRSKVDYEKFPRGRHYLQDISSLFKYKFDLLNNLIHEIKLKQNNLSNTPRSEQDYSNFVEDIELKLQEIIIAVQNASTSIKWEEDKMNPFQMAETNIEVNQ